jgi:hypothetical protein
LGMGGRLFAPFQRVDGFRLSLRPRRGFDRLRPERAAARALLQALREQRVRGFDRVRVDSRWIRREFLANCGEP